MVSDDNDTKSQHNKGIEVNLLDIVLLVLKYKWLIVVITVAAATFPIIFDIKLINLPSSQHPSIASVNNFARCTLLAKDENAESLINFLQIIKVKSASAENEGLIKAMKDMYWDGYNMVWVTKPTFTKHEIEATLGSMLRITQEKNIIDLRMYHDRLDIAQKILEFFLLELTKDCNKLIANRIKEKDLFIRDMTREYNNIKDQTLRKEMAKYIAEALAEKKKAALSHFTAFEILEPPSINPTPPILILRPKQVKGSKVIVLFASLAFVFSMFLAFGIEWFRLLNNKHDYMGVIKRYFVMRK